MLNAPSYQGEYCALAASALFILLTIGTETLRPVLPSVRYSMVVMMLQWSEMGLQLKALRPLCIFKPSKVKLMSRFARPCGLLRIVYGLSYNGNYAYATGQERPGDG